MEAEQPLLPTEHSCGKSYSCRNETVNLCFKGKMPHCGAFSTRSLVFIFIPGLSTGLNAAFSYTASINGEAMQWASYANIAASVVQIATGVFMENIHKPFRTEYCGFPCINHGNIVAGSACLIINSIFLYLQYEVFPTTDITSSTISSIP